MQDINRYNLGLRQSIRERNPTKSPTHRTFVSTPSPIIACNKLPLLIKGKIPLNISRKYYFHSDQRKENSCSVISSAAETDKGLIRDYNEDKVTIFYENTTNLSPIYFYGLYDGHGGSRCAEFLKSNLHNYVLKDPEIRSDPNSAIFRAFSKAETSFLEEAKIHNLDRSGSCGIICLILNNKCYIANLGDSRAVLSMGKGSRVLALSKDHKPYEQLEMTRIMQAGGYVYQSNNYHSVPAVMGPYRVFPGRLSVSRTIGDIYAKLSQYGGNSNVIIPTPEIKSFNLTPEHDFILMCSDGVFDRVDNAKAVECVWESFKENLVASIDQKCSQAARKLIALAMERRSMDNVTVIIVALTNLQDN